MADDEAPRKLPTADKDAQGQALEQADEYESLFGNTPLELNNGEVLMIPPHPQWGMIDDDALEAYDEHLYRVDTMYDREPDIHIPEQKVKDDKGLELTMPAEIQRGALKVPFRITDADGVTTMVKPPNQTRIVQIALGEENYRKLREGGKQTKDVFKIWGEQSNRMRERQLRDSKSNASSLAVAPVPPANR